MESTFQAKIKVEGLTPLFAAIAELYGRAERHLYVDLYLRKRPLKECKREYLIRFGLTARQFNALITEKERFSHVSRHPGPGGA